MSRLDAAKTLMRVSNRPAVYTSQNPTRSAEMWGFVTDQVRENHYGVELDSGVEITAYSDSIHNTGDRVLVQYQSGTWYIISSAGLIKQIEDTHEDLSTTIDAKAKEITEAAERDLQVVRDAFDAFKATHELTDEDITKSIEDTARDITVTFEGKISDLDEVYTTKTEFKTGIDGVSSTVEEYYENLNAGMIQQGTLIQQNAEGIQANARNITTALTNAKSYTDSQLSITSTNIKSEVTKSIMDSVGNTYVSNTKFNQYSDSVRLDINKGVNADTWLSTHFDFDDQGLTVYGGSSKTTGYKSRVGTGSFSILDAGNNPVFVIQKQTDNSIWLSTNRQPIAIVSSGSSSLGIDNVGRFIYGASNSSFEIGHTYTNVVSECTPAAYTSGSLNFREHAAPVRGFEVTYQCSQGGTVKTVKGYGDTVKLSMTESTGNYYSAETITVSRTYVTRGTAVRTSIMGEGQCYITPNAENEFAILKIGLIA